MSRGSLFPFKPVMRLPQDLTLFDFSQGDPGDIVRSRPYGIGRYLEHRPGIYKADHYTEASGEARSIHMGVDLFAPVGTEVCAFASGRIYLMGYNSKPLDYGHTIITEHELGGVSLFALYGHLSKASLIGKKVGQDLVAGEVLAWVGEHSENGGWLPHLHFQLSWLRPQVPDLPGVVAPSQLSVAQLIYPDPRLVLGPIY